VTGMMEIPGIFSAKKVIEIAVFSVRLSMVNDSGFKPNFFRSFSLMLIVCVPGLSR